MKYDVASAALFGVFAGTAAFVFYTGYVALFREQPEPVPGNVTEEPLPTAEDPVYDVSGHEYGWEPATL